MEDRAAQVAFMKQYSFATIVTCADGVPYATHLPFTVSEADEKLILQAHFSKANPHAALMGDRVSLVIFAEPHAYVSPAHYDKVMSVPTWNYVAVHAYGQAKVLKEDAEKFAALEEMIDHYEPAYRKQWQEDLTGQFKQAMLKGIVLFSLEVTRIEAQEKLSQNKTRTERERIKQSLAASAVATDRSLAAYMQHSLEREQR